MILKEFLKIFYNSDRTVTRIKLVAETADSKILFSTKSEATSIVIIAPIQRIYEDPIFSDLTVIRSGIEDMQTIYVVI